MAFSFGGLWAKFVSLEQREKRVNRPSIERGRRSTAQNSANQYGQEGLSNAMSSGDTALINDVTRTR